ncbi:MAG: UDP-N-acetylmuramate dehydrogenase [Cyanobacteria bacterium J083]|nr:MAG: UDP-N-acetylmuramate dehydrogenase [Cyanobacteria bacterium J083]
MNQSPIILPGTDCIIEPDTPLANLASYRVGGNAQWYVAPRNLEQLYAAFEWYQKQDMPLTMLGAGSNLLISDHGIPGLTLSTRYLRYTNFDLENFTITADAGEPVAKLAWRAAKRGWSGLEWAVGIPATVGGAIVMNAGAHDACVADVLVSAKVVKPNGEIEILTPRELAYSYRTSSLQGQSKVVVQGVFQLKPGFTKDEIMATTTANLHQRKSSQPYHLPSCGSVFRNPQPQAAGWLIEQLGLKGYKIGDAQVAHRHANFILNCGKATANDIFQLINYVQEQVDKHWSLSLEPEVKLVGEFS